MCVCSERSEDQTFADCVFQAVRSEFQFVAQSLSQQRMNRWRAVAERKRLQRRGFVGARAITVPDDDDINDDDADDDNNIDETTTITTSGRSKSPSRSKSPAAVSASRSRSKSPARSRTK